MQDTPRLRVALIGLGDIAQKAYLPLVTRNAHVRPVLCTRDRATLLRLKDSYRVEEAYTDLDELLREPPAAAMVHSSTDSHAQLVAALLEAGIPTFVDKPLTYSLEESERLIDLALRKQVPLFLGFNRRYAPLVAGLKEAPAPLQVSWQKNRVDLPEEARSFVLDDFIHVVDGLRFLAPAGEVEDLSVHHHTVDGRLGSIQVRWRQGGCLLTGGMNRVAGKTEERIEYFTEGNTWRIKELHEGVRYRDGRPEPLGFGNWTPTLEKRGFQAMLDEWFRVVRERDFDPEWLDDVRRTHALCEEVLKRVEGQSR